jgi:hypothetical protein
MRVIVLVKAKAGIMPSTGEGLHPSAVCRLCLIPRQPKSRREREPAHDVSGAHPRGTDGSNPVPSSGESEFRHRRQLIAAAPSATDGLRVLIPFQQRRRATVAVSYSLSDLGPLTNGLSRR